MFSVYIYLYAKIYCIITSYIGLYGQRNLISNIFQKKIEASQLWTSSVVPGMVPVPNKEVSNTLWLW